MGAPEDCTLEDTVVLKAVRKSTDVDSASFSKFIDSHLDFFLFLDKDGCSCKSIDIFLTFPEINGICIFQNEMRMFFPVVFIISKSKSTFFFYPEDICQLEETSLILVGSRFADSDDSTAVVYESADDFCDRRIGPPFTAGVGCVGISYIDDHIDVIEDRSVLQDILETDEFYIERSAGQRLNDS